uniref:Uncharacterized protein n=1 Tax=Leersia perrieri TaxID=77586 RepID=A0A0D9VHA9_9ORYZ
MEQDQDLPALKPQWLVQGQASSTGATNFWTHSSPRPGPDNQGRGGSSRNHSSGHNRDQNSRASSLRVAGSNGPRRHDRDGMGKSRGYGNFGRNREREREKDFDSRDRESRSVTADRDGFGSFSTCKPERDRLNRSRSKTDKGVVSINNCNTSRSNTGGVSFEREFPQLSSEDKNGKQDNISRVPSPGITSPIQRIPPITATDRWNSVLADVPVSSEPNKNLVASSISRPAPSKQPEAAPNSVASLSMAETVMQVPLRISVGPQLSIEAQKVEEIALRQNTLRPMAFPAIKSSVTSSSKTKGARNGDPSGPSKATHQSLIPSANGSARAPVKTDLSKVSQPRNFKILTREQSCTTHTAKNCPDNPMSPPAPVAPVEPLKRPCVSQKSKVATHGHPLSLLQGAYVDKKLNALGRHKFFQILRTNSSNGSSSTVESGCPSSSVTDVKQDSCLSLGKDISLYHPGMKCMENGKCSCEEANSSDGSQRHLSDNEENNLSLEQAADGVSQNLIVESRSDSSSELAADRGDEFRVFLSNNSEGSSSAPADSDDGYKRSHSVSEEASLSSEATDLGDEYPAEDSLPADFVAFMISLGWEKDKQVEPLGLEEIAVTVRANEELQQKLLSMEDNANIKIVLLYISSRGLDKELQRPNAGTKLQCLKP